MSFTREVRKSSVAQNRPLYSVSSGADRPYAKKSRASGLHGSSLSLGLDDDGGRAAAAAAGSRPSAAAAGKVHLVNADTLVGMVHELCQQVAVYSDRLVEVERRLDERDFDDSDGGACSPQSRVLPGADVEVKLESLASQLRTAEAAAASKEIQRDLEMRELRSKVTQIELLSSSTFTAPKQPDPFAHVLPTTLYDGKGGVGGGDEPFVPGLPAGAAAAAGFAASPVPSQIATYCKLLQRDVLDTVGEQCRQKKTLAALEKAVEGAEHNLTALRDYVVKVTSLGFPETTSASGFSCDRPAVAAASAAAATAAAAAEGGPNLLVSLFQRIADVDHRLALVEADGYVEHPHDTSDDAVAAPDPKRADYMRRTGAPGPGHHRGAKFQLSTSSVSPEQQQQQRQHTAGATGSGRSPSPSLVDLMSDPDPDVDVASASVPMPAPPQPLRESLSGGDDDVAALARAGSGGSQRAAQPMHRFAPVKLAGYEEEDDDVRVAQVAAAPAAAVRRRSSGEKASPAAPAEAAVQAARDDLRQREEALQRRMAAAEEREGAARRAAAEAERAAAAREAGAKRAADELQERRRRLEEDEQRAEVRAALARRREAEAEAEAAAASAAAAAAAAAREVEQRRAAAEAEAAAAAAEAVAEVERAASRQSAKSVEEVKSEELPPEEEEKEEEDEKGTQEVRSPCSWCSGIHTHTHTHRIPLPPS